MASEAKNVLLAAKVKNKGTFVCLFVCLFVFSLNFSVLESTKREKMIQLVIG